MRQLHKEYRAIVMKYLMILISILLFASSSFALEISETDVRNFLSSWLDAQNKGSYSEYAAMYSKSFVGIRRSANSTRKLGYDAWLKDRKNMFKKKMLVAANAPEIKISGATASVKFEQIWESGTYKDKGDKVLDLVLEGRELRIIQEEMLFSSAVALNKKQIEKVVTDSDSNSTHEINSPTLGYTSKFTSIYSKNCSKLPKQMDDYFEKLGLYGDECPAPEGWRLFVVVGGDRSWIDIAHGNSLWTTEQEVVYKNDNFFGYFPNITSNKTEWRINRAGYPSALIFRITAQNPEHVGRNISRLFIVSLKDDIPRFCGTAKTNEEARVVADKATACHTILPKRQFQIATEKNDNN